MAQIIQKISVDVSKPNFFQAIVAKQYDSGTRFVKATFIHNNEKIHIESTAEVTINAQRSDGSTKSFAGEVNGDGTATLPLTYWMLELVGTVKCDISVFSGDSRLTSTNFDLEVEKASNNSGDVSEDENYDVLLSLIEKVEAITNTESTTNKVTKINEKSTDDQYPSAKATFDLFSVVNPELEQKIADSIGENTYNKDITDALGLTQGTYNKSSGYLASTAPNSQATPLFDVKVGEKYFVTGCYGYVAALIVAFDENKAYLADKSVFSAVDDNFPVDDYEYVIPEGVAYIACSTRNASTRALSVKKEVTDFKNVQEEFKDVRKEIEGTLDLNKVAIDIVQKGESIKEYTVESGTLADNTANEVTNQARRRTDYIAIYGSNIRLTIPEGLQVYIWEFDKDKNFVKYSGWHKGTVEYEVSNPYIRLTVKNDKSDDTITDEQVKGIVVSEYSPLLATDEPTPDPEPDTDTDEEIVLSEAEIKACQDFSGLFVSTTGRAETLLFFTDPHLAHETDVYPKFDFMLDKIKAVYDSAPVSTCVSGGDWLLDGNTKENASWLLGKIDGAMKSRFKKYINVLGNHDTNYLGDAYKENLNQADHVKCILSNTTLANLWYRNYGKNYFAVDGDCTKFYVFDTGLDWDATMNDYRWEQVDWFANSLLEENPERCAILLHIGTKGYVATPMVDNLTKVAQAFNNKTTLTLNNITYDFTDSTGHVYFALSGHAHVDMALMQNDIPVVLTAQTCKYTDTTPTYDLVLADYGANKLRLVRVGEERSHEGTDDFDDNSIRTFDMA